jgi:hypothetical protein
LTISFMAPNDGSGDWGVRYLSFIFLFIPFARLKIKKSSKKIFIILLLISSFFQYLYIFKVSKVSSKIYQDFKKDVISHNINIYFSSYSLFYYNYGKDFFNINILQISNPRSWIYLKNHLLQSNKCARYVYFNNNSFDFYAQKRDNLNIFVYKNVHPIIMHDAKEHFNYSYILDEKDSKFYRIIQLCPK